MNAIVNFHRAEDKRIAWQIGYASHSRMSASDPGCVKTQKKLDHKNIGSPERAVFNFSEVGNGQATLENA
jgi:hypothetical protein